MFQYVKAEKGTNLMSSNEKRQLNMLDKLSNIKLKYRFF